MSIIDRDAWAKYQASMLTGQALAVRPPSYMAKACRDARNEMRVLHPEVQPPRSRHRRTAFWTAAFVLWAAFCFAVGASATACTMLVRDALVKSKPTMSDVVGDALVQWMQGGVR